MTSSVESNALFAKMKMKPISRSIEPRVKSNPTLVVLESKELQIADLDSGSIGN